MRGYIQTQVHEIIVIPPDDAFLPSPAFSQAAPRARRPPTSYNALAISEAHPRTLVVSASAQGHSRPQSPHFLESGSGSKDAELPPPALPALPATATHQRSIVVTPLTPVSPVSLSASQTTPTVATATATAAATTASGPLVALNYSTNSTAGSPEVNTACGVPPANNLSCQHHDKQVRRGRASGTNLLLLSPTSPQPSKDDTARGDALVVDNLASTIQPSKAMDPATATDPGSAPETLPAKEAALGQSQNDLAVQVETLTAQLNRLQRQCDQMAGLMLLKDWVTSLWMKRTRNWEAQAAELERDRDHLRKELERSKASKAFWRRTAIERFTVSHQWEDLCQRQTEEIVDLKQRVTKQQGKVEMLEMLLDEAGSVTSTASTELARSVDELEDPEDLDEQEVIPKPQDPSPPSAAHPSFPTRTSYISTISTVSSTSTSGSSAAESYTDDLDVDDNDLPSPPSEPSSPAPAESEPESTHSKEELKYLLAELRAGQTEFEAHLAKYAADRDKLNREWDKLVEAQDRLDEEYEHFDASVSASDEAAARRAAIFERRANILLDQEMELDLLKRRYMDKIRNYELISVDLKRREDRFFATLDHVHILAEDTEKSRMQNEAAERVLREEWNEVEDAWMAVWRRQKRLVKAAQLCQCPCVCGNRRGVESWSDDEVPALLLGEEGRESERAHRVRAIVEEEMKKRRDEERNQGRRLRCVRDCECPECAPDKVESPTFDRGPPDQDGLHGLALELLVASCPPGHVVPPVEGDVNVQQPANDVLHEEESQREREEAVHREEVHVEGNSSEWEEERSSSSLELRNASPKSPLVIPDSPNARAELYLLEDDMFIVLEVGLTRRGT